MSAKRKSIEHPTNSEHEFRVYRSILNRKKYLRKLRLTTSRLDLQLAQHSDGLAHLILDKHPEIYRECLDCLCLSKLCVDSSSFLKITFLLANESSNLNYEKRDVFLKALRVCPEEAKTQLSFYEDSLSNFDFAELIRFIPVAKSSSYYAKCVEMYEKVIHLRWNLKMSRASAARGTVGTLPLAHEYLAENAEVVQSLREDMQKILDGVYGMPATD